MRKKLQNAISKLFVLMSRFLWALSELLFTVYCISLSQHGGSSFIVKAAVESVVALSLVGAAGFRPTASHHA